MKLHVKFHKSKLRQSGTFARAAFCAGNEPAGSIFTHIWRMPCSAGGGKKSSLPDCPKSLKNLHLPLKKLNLFTGVKLVY